MPTTWPRSSRRADSAARRELEYVLGTRGATMDDDRPGPPWTKCAPVAAQGDARGIPPRRSEHLDRGDAVRAIPQPERVRRGVEGVLEDPPRDRTRVGARQRRRPVQPFATGLGALAVEETPVSAAQLLPQPEGRVRPQPILEVQLGGDPRIGIRRAGVDAVLADQQRGAPPRPPP